MTSEPPQQQQPDLSPYRKIADYVGSTEPADLPESTIRHLVGMIETGEILFRHLMATGGSELCRRVKEWNGTGPTWH